MENKIKNGSDQGTKCEEFVRNKGKKFNIWRGIYNKDKNYILGRTPQNWGNGFEVDLCIFFQINHH